MSGAVEAASGAAAAAVADAAGADAADTDEVWDSCPPTAPR